MERLPQLSSDASVDHDEHHLGWWLYATVQVVLGGVLVLIAGVLIGKS